MTVQADGLIEDDGLFLRQLDFANKMIGGGALGHVRPSFSPNAHRSSVLAKPPSPSFCLRAPCAYGAMTQGLVQEEIRFMICPELIASMLFTEVMEDNEAVVITGVERYVPDCMRSSILAGFPRALTAGVHRGGLPASPTTRATPTRSPGTRTTSTPFPCTAPLRDPRQFVWVGLMMTRPSTCHSDPATGHRRTEVAAIDAISFHRVADNFEPYAVERELVKAAAGFWSDPSDPAPAAIATGTVWWLRTDEPVGNALLAHTAKPAHTRCLPITLQGCGAAARSAATRSSRRSCS